MSVRKLKFRGLALPFNEASFSQAMFDKDLMIINRGADIEGIVLLYNHAGGATPSPETKQEMPIGKIYSHELRQDGLYVEGFILIHNSYTDDIARLVEHSVLTGISVTTTKVGKKYNIEDISIVDIPDFINARITEVVGYEDA